ncbi:MAG: porin [Bacteriovoracaceae bacterium]|nr:porin [Bacteriovoracaceae bacterium]
MNKLLLIIAALLFTANAYASPKIYGKVNVETRYVDQDVAGYRKMVPVNTVENLPSRLGILGLYNVKNLGLNIMYFGELGLAPRATTTNVGGILKLRMVGLKFQHRYGEIKIGKAYTAAALVGALIDPLVDTGAAGIGYDQAKDISGVQNGNTTGSGIGYSSRQFLNVLGYKSPKFYGFQLSVSLDNNYSDELKQSSGLNSAYSATYVESLLTYDLELGASKSNLSLGYISGHGTNMLTLDFWGKTIDQENRLIVALKTKLSSFTLAGSYMDTQTEESTTTNEPNISKLFLALQYDLGKHSLIGTFSQAKYDLDTAKTDADTKTQTQFAFGYKYRFNDKVTFNTTVATFENAEDNAALAATLDNKATSAMIGASLNF